MRGSAIAAKTILTIAYTVCALQAATFSWKIDGNDSTAHVEKARLPHHADGPAMHPAAPVFGKKPGPSVTTDNLISLPTVIVDEEGLNPSIFEEPFALTMRVESSAHSRTNRNFSTTFGGFPMMSARRAESLSASGNMLFMPDAAIEGRNDSQNSSGRMRSFFSNSGNNGNDGAIHLEGDDGSYAGVITPSGNLIKVGNGRLTLSGANSYAGETKVNGGELVVAGEKALGNTSGIRINHGTLTLAVQPVFSGSTPVRLNGGTLNLNDQSATFGELIVSSSSSIQLNSGGGASGALTFTQASISGSPTLTIHGWSGSADRDRIFITGTASQAFLAAVNFNGYASGATLSGTELVPVPEPAETALVAGFILLAVAAFRRRNASGI